MADQDEEEEGEEGGADFMDDGQGGDAVDLHEDDAADEGDAVAHAHEDLKGGELPTLLGCDGVDHQGDQAHNGKDDMGGHARHSQKEQGNGDGQQNRGKNQVFFHGGFLLGFNNVWGGLSAQALLYLVGAWGNEGIVH